MNKEMSLDEKIVTLVKGIVLLTISVVGGFLLRKLEELGNYEH